MNTRNQLLCVWAGLLALLGFFIGTWPLAQFIPPWPPLLDTADVVQRYQTNANGIRFGALALMTGGAFLIPFAAVIATHLKRIEGAHPVMAYSQLGGGIGVAIMLLVPGLMFTVTAFRPERSPELTQLLNDLSWICFVMPFPPALIQNLAIGLGIIADRSERPLFPRWVGFFNIWVGILFVPGGMITFFKSGPFAWDGIIAFWLPAVVFGVWFTVMVPVLLKIIKNQATIQ